MSDEHEDICGETYDHGHDRTLIDEQDGYRHWECQVCGADFQTAPGVAP